MEDHISIIPSQRFREILLEFRESPDAPKWLRENQTHEHEIRLRTDDVEWCHTKLRSEGREVRIHELISESEIVLPKYTEKPRNPELEARIRRLRDEQANRAYRDMTKSVDATYQRENLGLGDIGRDIRVVNQQIVSGMQYFLSVIGTFFAIFVGLGVVTDDYGARAIGGCVAAVVVGVAELYFIIRQDVREEGRIGKEK